MKKTFYSLLVSFNIFACEPPAPHIAEYESCHKEAIFEMMMQQELSFFEGAEAVVEKGLMTKEDFMTNTKKALAEHLENPAKIKRVLTIAGKVVGFVEVSKSREESVESIIKMMKASGQPFDEGKVTAILSNLKKTDKECTEFGLIASLMVLREFRSRGLGRQLLKDASQQIKRHWPLLEQVRLAVSAYNSIAIKLYESEDYKKSEIQPAHLVLAKMVEYQKTL